MFQVKARMKSMCEPITTGFKRKLDMAEPFHGIGGFKQFCHDVGLGCRFKLCIDIDEELEDFTKLACEKLGIPENDSQTFGKLGDILKYDMKKFPLIDFLSCGPTCSPWAGNGERLAMEDPRAQHYVQLVRWIIYLAKLGSLLGFQIENSKNIENEINGYQAMAKKMIDWMEEEIPTFVVRPDVIKNEKAIPHVRNRCWLRGLRGDVLFNAAGQLMAVPRPLMTFGFEPPPLRSFLLHDLPNIPLNKWEGKKRHDHIMSAISKVQQDVQEGRAGDIAVIDIDRKAPDKKDKGRSNFGSDYVMYDKIPALRVRGPDLLLLTTHDLEKPWDEKEFCRLLSGKERFELQGHDMQKDEFQPPEAVSTHAYPNFPAGRRTTRKEE